MAIKQGTTSYLILEQFSLLKRLFLNTYFLFNRKAYWKACLKENRVPTEAELDYILEQE